MEETRRNAARRRPSQTRLQQVMDPSWPLYQRSPLVLPPRADSFFSSTRKRIAMLVATVIVIVALIVTYALTHSTVSRPSPRSVTNASKAGLAWPNGNGIDITQYESTDKVSWYYTWSPNGIDTNLEFVPMLWGQAQVDDFTSSIGQTIATGNIHAILGMNEPQEPAQSNLTPEQGAQMWMTYLEPHRSQSVQLGSPAPSSAPSGLTWLQAFFTACAGHCTVDFIALHWYDVNATAFQSYLQTFYDTFQRPIWVTEWACQNYNNANAQCTKDDVVLFLNQTQHFMDTTPWVERYAWFGAMENLGSVNQDNALMDRSGKINDLGKQYIGAEPPMLSGAEASGAPVRTEWPNLAVLSVSVVIMVVFVLR